MKIEIELPAKVEDPLSTVVAILQETNGDPGLTAEDILGQVCRQYIAQEYGKYLVE